MTKFFDIFTGERIAFNLDFGRGMALRVKQDKRAAEANARAQAEAVAECVMPSDGPAPVWLSEYTQIVVTATPQPDADGWIPHDGKGFPEAAKAFERIDFKFLDGTVYPDYHVKNRYEQAWLDNLDRTHWRPHVAEQAADTWNPMSEEPKVEKVYEVRCPTLPDDQFYSLWKNGEWRVNKGTSAEAEEETKRSFSAYNGRITGWREVQA